MEPIKDDAFALNIPLRSFAATLELRKITRSWLAGKAICYGGDSFA